ncbi:MAG: enoyl-CoA hydratase [Burkholderiales bacterium]
MTQGEDGGHCNIDVANDGIATVTIANAGTLNILSGPVIDDVTRNLDALRDRSDLRVLVMRGTGDKAFIGGADIKEMAGLTRESAERFITGLRRLCDALRQFPTPVIARMPGWSLGGGLEVAMACDIRIASDTANFGMPEVKVGIPSVIHAALMPRLIGSARANWLILTGENIDAAQALAWGLVDRVVPLADLDVEVTRIASLLAGYGTNALRQQKRLLREWEDRPLDQSIAESVAEFGRAFDTGESQRYMGEFVKRQREKKLAP